MLITVLMANVLRFHRTRLLAMPAKHASPPVTTTVPHLGTRIPIEAAATVGKVGETPVKEAVQHPPSRGLQPAR